jgi:hypothetical protein
MEFALLVGGGLVFLAVAFIALGKYYPGSGAAQLDWKPTRSLELEVELEEQDIGQMLEAKNERRRRLGKPEVSEADVRANVDRAEREQRERRAAYRRGSGV